MSFTIHTPDTYISMPWKNGKGQTIELIREDIKNTEYFSWRLSKAQVSSDGEFSEFDGYERTLVLLSGGGLTLEHQHTAQHILTEPLQYAQFSGAEKTTASLHNGPIDDFNIMTKKDYCRATITTCNSTEKAALDNRYDLLFVYAVSMSVIVSPKSEDQFYLPAQHLLQARNWQRDIELSGGAHIAIGIDYEDLAGSCRSGSERISIT